MAIKLVFWSQYIWKKLRCGINRNLCRILSSQLSSVETKHSLSSTLCRSSMSIQSRFSLRMETLRMHPLKLSRDSKQPLEAMSEKFRYKRNLKNVNRIYLVSITNLAVRLCRGVIVSALYPHCVDLTCWLWRATDRFSVQFARHHRELRYYAICCRRERTFRAEQIPLGRVCRRPCHKRKRSENECLLNEWW